MITSTPDPGSRADECDRDVIVLAERGDSRTALHHLMTRYGVSVYRYCRAMLRDPVLAEDVHQQIFIQAFRDLPRFSGRSTLRAWLFAIARNRSIDAARARRRAQAHLEDSPAPDAPDPRPSPGEALDEARLRQALVQSLGRLDRRIRRAVLLRYLRGLTFPEIAAMCGEKPGTLAARVARALPLLGLDLEAFA